MSLSLNLEIKLLLIILDEYSHYKNIVEETKNCWENYENELWDNLLIEYGFKDKMPSLSEILKIDSKVKKYRNKNIKIHKNLHSRERLIAQIYRDTRSLRAEKHEELKKIFNKPNRVRVSLLHSRIKKITESRKIA